MDVINEIIRDSAIGDASRLYKSLVLLIFATIVFILAAMLVLLLVNGSQTNINFGYLYAI